MMAPGSRFLHEPRRQIPFGPYLLAGALLALFFGDAVINWYFGLLLGQ